MDGENVCGENVCGENVCGENVCGEDGCDAKMYAVISEYEHVLKDIYGYALEHRVPSQFVDVLVRDACAKHDLTYGTMVTLGCSEAEVRRLCIHVLDHHVFSELEKIVRG